MTWVVLVLATVLTACLGYNLEPRHADIISDPAGDRASYFGYSVSFWQESKEGRNTTWLLAGAPRGSLGNFTGDRVRQPGVVYKCRLDTADRDRCYVIPVLGNGERTEQDLIWRGRIKDIPARSWLGATIAVQNKPNGAVAVCAPRMKQMVNQVSWLIPGLCYYWQNETSISPLAQLDSVYRYSHGGTRSGFLTGLGQVGISAHFVQDSLTNQLVVGAPGVYYFKGEVAVYEQDIMMDGGRSLASLHMPTSSMVKYDSFLGYSVTSARLHKDGRVSYISGAPRAEGADFFTGVVYVMEQPTGPQWISGSTLKGTQMGEYFGACVAAVDLDEDGLDDLVVVGAPLHSTRAVNEESALGDQGRLYIFFNSGEGRLEQAGDILVGSAVPGARFASSVAVIGDLNKDGFRDLAVGAPYEGSGAVYIYHGQEGGLRNKHSQRISAEEVGIGVPGFGISISSEADVDDNSFNDIAIGSYGTSSAVVIKSHPVIAFKASLKPSVKKLDINAEEFSTKACLQYSTQARPDQLLNIDAEMTVRVDPSLRRAVLSSDGFPEDHTLTRQVRLSRNTPICWTIAVKRQGNLFQVVQPIDFIMDYKIVDDAPIDREREFCKMCPVTDPHKHSSIKVTVPFAHGCKEKTVCRSDLRVDVESSHQGGIVLGKDSKINFKVTVSNSAEPAYMAKMAFTLPRKKMMLKLPPKCYQDESDQSKNVKEEVIICSLGNPLESIKKSKINHVETQFEVDLSGLDLHTSLLMFNVTAWSADEELTPSDNNVIIKVPVKLVSELNITGNTMQKYRIISSQGDNSTAVIPLYHHYEIVNYGPSPIKRFGVKFMIPVGFSRGGNEDVAVFGNLRTPQVMVGSHTSPCVVDYSVLHTRDSSSWGVVQETQEKAPPQGSVDLGLGQRRRRSVTEWKDNGTVAESFQVRSSLHLNCSGAEGSVCVSVDCVAGPLPPLGRASVFLHLYINTSILEYVMVGVDAVQLSTVGRVNIKGEEEYEVPSGLRFKIARVETVFLGEVTADKIASWILPLSIAVGLLFFLILTKVLSNVGFFKRTQKEQMELLKEEEQAMEEFEIIGDFKPHKTVSS